MRRPRMTSELTSSDTLIPSVYLKNFNFIKIQFTKTLIQNLTTSTECVESLDSGANYNDFIKFRFNFKHFFFI